MKLIINHKKFQRLFSKLALMLLVLVAVESQAATCGPYDTNADRDIDIPVLGPTTVTIPESLPIGAKIYGQTYVIKLGEWGWRCSWPSSERPVTIQRVYTMEAVSTPSGAPITSGNETIFPTNIPGIGFTITEHFTSMSGNSIYPAKVFDTPIVDNGVGSSSKGKASGLLMMSFVKTGPISTIENQQIQLSSLPTFHTSIGVTSPDPFDHVIWKLRFSGVLNIASRTCQVDDVDVELGSHQLADLPRSGSASEWKEFNITLRNCPAFVGYPFSSSSFVHDESGNSQSSGRMVSSSIDMTFSSVHGYYTSYIANIESGPDSAVGFGIQLATATNSTPNIFIDGTKISQSKLGVVLTEIDGANYVIPLKARYYRYVTNGAMPGKANGAVMFTVNYY